VFGDDLEFDLCPEREAGYAEAGSGRLGVAEAGLVDLVHGGVVAGQVREKDRHIDYVIHREAHVVEFARDIAKRFPRFFFESSFDELAVLDSDLAGKKDDVTDAAMLAEKHG